MDQVGIYGSRISLTSGFKWLFESFVLKLLFLTDFLGSFMLINYCDSWNPVYREISLWFWWFEHRKLQFSPFCRAEVWSHNIFELNKRKWVVKRSTKANTSPSLGGKQQFQSLGWVQSDSIFVFARITIAFDWLFLQIVLVFDQFGMNTSVHGIRYFSDRKRHLVER